MISNHMTGFAIAPLPFMYAARVALPLLVASLRDTAAPAARRVLVDRTALRGAIEDARCLSYGALRDLATLLDGVARRLHGRARGGAGERLDGRAPRRLTNALEG